MSVLDTAAELVRGRVPFVQATVVRAQKPTSAHAGDTALVRADGVIDGFVGGPVPRPRCASTDCGCSRATSRCCCGSCRRPARPARRRARSPWPTPACPGGRWRSSWSRGCPRRGSWWSATAPIAAALAELGRPLGFAVELVAGETASPAADDAALVVASYGRGEEPALTTALGLGVPYIGLIASRKRGAAVLAALDVSEEQKARIHTPAGLDIKARTAPEIALSVLAEIVQERRAGQQAHPLATPEPASAVDPVCGMTVAAVEATPHAEVDGVVHWFCCPGCRRAFLKDPAAYATAS